MGSYTLRVGSGGRGPRGGREGAGRCVAVLIVWCSSTGGRGARGACGLEGSSVEGGSVPGGRARLYVELEWWRSGFGAWWWWGLWDEGVEVEEVERVEEEGRVGMGAAGWDWARAKMVE